MKSTASKIAEIFVMSADLPDFENYISTEQIDEVSSSIHVRAFIYVCMFMEVCLCICIAVGHLCMAAGK